MQDMIRWYKITYTKVVHTDRRYKRRREVVIWESKQYASLPYARITNKKQFEQ